MVPVPAADARCAEEILEHALAPSTRHEYAWRWKLFCQYCSERKLCSLPASPQVLVCFLATRQQSRTRPLSYASARYFKAAIDRHHRDAGLPPPGESYLVRQFIRAVHRKQRVAINAGALPDRARRPMTARAVVQILNRHPDDISAVAITAAFVFFARAGTIMRATSASWTFLQSDDGTPYLRFREPHVKNEERIAPRSLMLPLTSPPLRLLAQRLKRLLRAANPGGLLFLPRIGGHSDPANRLTRLLRDALRTIGVDEDTVARTSSHSLRQGGVCAAAAINVPEQVMQRWGGWANEHAMAPYLVNPVLPSVEARSLLGFLSPAALFSRQL